MQRTEGIVLRSVDYGETHKILTVLTPNAGKLSMMARGAKKPLSPLSAATQLFVQSQFLVAGNVSSGSGMVTVIQADIIRSFSSIREDLWKTAYAAYYAEHLNRQTEERVPIPGVYPFLLSTLGLLSDDKDAEVLTRIFEMKMLQVAGVDPVLDACAHCGHKDRDLTAFSFFLAGPLCSLCKYADPQAFSMNAVTIRLLQVFQKMKMDQLGNVNISAPIRKELDEILKGYQAEHLGQPLRSRQFIDQLYKYNL